METVALAALVILSIASAVAHAAAFFTGLAAGVVVVVVVALFVSVAPGWEPEE